MGRGLSAERGGACRPQWPECGCVAHTGTYAVPGPPRQQPMPSRLSGPPSGWDREVRVWQGQTQGGLPLGLGAGVLHLPGGMAMTGTRPVTWEPGRCEPTGGPWRPCICTCSPPGSRNHALCNLSKKPIQTLCVKSVWLRTHNQ